MEKIKYLGHSLKSLQCLLLTDRDSRRQDPDQAATNQDMPSPNNIATLQNFLGLTNYYQIFIPNMHDLRALLNELLKNFGYELWVWTTEYQQAFEK